MFRVLVAVPSLLISEVLFVMYLERGKQPLSLSVKLH